MNQGGLTGDDAAASAASESSTAARTHGQRNHSADAVGASNRNMLAGGIDCDFSPELRIELPNFADVHALADGTDLREPHLGSRVDHAWINMQPLALDNASAFGRGEIAAHPDDFSIAHQNRSVLNLRARHRMDGGSPNQETVVVGTEQRKREQERKGDGFHSAGLLCPAGAFFFCSSFSLSSNFLFSVSRPVRSARSLARSKYSCPSKKTF